MVKCLWLVALVACQGNRDTPTTNPPRDASFPVAIDAAVAVVDAEGPAVGDAKLEEPDPPDSGKLIAELDAVPAWQTVIDRAQLLARRDQHGVAYGRIGPAIQVPETPAPATGSGSGSAVRAGSGSASPKPVMVASPYVWLVDDTEGNGTLGIRIALGNKPLKEGDRVAVGGSWHLDDAHRWYWKVDSVQPLPPAAPSELKDPKPPEPSHVVANGNLIPGSHTITVAKDNDAVYFSLVGPPPANDGDGWSIANELGDPVYALLILPGERASYGGQDMRAPDERWSLRRGQTYTLRIGHIRTRTDKPAVIHARTAPVRVN